MRRTMGIYNVSKHAWWWSLTETLYQDLRLVGSTDQYFRAVPVPSCRPVFINLRAIGRTILQALMG